ncbi:MAG: hypothetical protein ABEJ89_06805 [Haloarculaceae archaeon]
MTVEIRGTATLLRLSEAVPGETGSRRITVRNVGDRRARLVVANVTVDDRENGIVGPERGVDTSPNEGEL